MKLASIFSTLFLTVLLVPSISYASAPEKAKLPTPGLTLTQSVALVGGATAVAVLYWKLFVDKNQDFVHRDKPTGKAMRKK